MPVNYALPPDTRAVGTGNPPSDINSVIDALNSFNFVSANVLSSTFSGGADPTGTNDSTTAIQAALTAAPAGTIVWIPSAYWNGSAWVRATYKYTTLSIPANVMLAGGLLGYRTTAIPHLECTTQTTGASVTFAAGTPAGAIAFMELDGSLLPAGAVDGIGCYVNCKQGSIRGINVHNFTQHGINIVQNGGNPDGWQVRDISSHNNASNGVNWDYAVDGQLDTFHLDNNGGSGLAVGTLNNWSATSGKCQQNTNYGYTGTGGFVKSNAGFTLCFSENNGKDGWHFDFSIGGGNGSLSITSCGGRDDGFSGISGSGYSAFYLNPKSVDVTITAFTTYVTSDTGGAGTIGPDYGLNLLGVLGNVAIIGGSFGGTIAGYNAGAGNTGTIGMTRMVQWTGQDGTTSSYRVVSTPHGVASSFHPTDPTAIAATTQEMMGLGGTCHITPVSSGIVLVNISAVYNDTVAETGHVSAYYGTGTAPANAAAVTGTVFGGHATESIGPVAANRPNGIAFTDLLTLTPGTAYWFDIGVDNGGGTGSVSVKNVSMSFVEV